MITKKWKELEKNKTRKDNASNVSKDMQIDRNMDAGRRDIERNPQRNEGQSNQQQMQQEDWQIQRRRNNNQQVKFNADRHGQQQQDQPGMVSIPTKNTYIDLDVQETTHVDEEGEDHMEQFQEQRQ